MNGNYAGGYGITGGTPEEIELSPDEKRGLRRAVSGIVSRTESYLPDGYVVGSELTYGSDGPEATVAVRPPAGHPVSAGFQPDAEDIEAGLDDADRDEVAKGLAASAAAQVMFAMGDDPVPVAR
ncbi:DUF5811 family protein [Halolamina salifodinae]|uniref:Uncharacterized protein n=1 Tax=Halolamina salifodinae TaxID=1202767 RepID=A0A8T4GTG2_9EURY|nr:DUF5811 family protein [Halolamina salifodinae]MBP1986297.1 hypothetical protein [Halolamina salifodinae]